MRYPPLQEIAELPDNETEGQSSMRRHLEVSKGSILSFKDSLSGIQLSHEEIPDPGMSAEEPVNNELLVPNNQFSPVQTGSRPSIQGDSSDSMMSPAASTFGIQTESLSSKLNRPDKENVPVDSKQFTQTSKLSSFKPKDFQVQNVQSTQKLTQMSPPEPRKEVSEKAAMSPLVQHQRYECQ
jgi:hypothetical protein